MNDIHKFSTVSFYHLALLINSHPASLILLKSELTINYISRDELDFPNLLYSKSSTPKLQYHYYLHKNSLTEIELSQFVPFSSHQKLASRWTDIIARLVKI